MVTTTSMPAFAMTRYSVNEAAMAPRGRVMHGGSVDTLIWPAAASSLRQEAFVSSHSFSNAVKPESPRIYSDNLVEEHAFGMPLIPCSYSVKCACNISAIRPARVLLTLFEPMPIAFSPAHGPSLIWAQSECTSSLLPHMIHNSSRKAPVTLSWQTVRKFRMLDAMFADFCATSFFSLRHRTAMIRCPS